MQDYTEIRGLQLQLTPPLHPHLHQQGAPLGSTHCSFFRKSSRGLRGNYAVVWRNISFPSHCTALQWSCPLTAPCGPGERVRATNNFIRVEGDRGGVSMDVFSDNNEMISFDWHVIIKLNFSFRNTIQWPRSKGWDFTAASSLWHAVWAGWERRSRWRRPWKPPLPQREPTAPRWRETPWGVRPAVGVEKGEDFQSICR